MARRVLSNSMWVQLQAVLKEKGCYSPKNGPNVDEEWAFIRGSYVRAHQHASGARCGEERAIGVSRGGPTTKIPLLSMRMKTRLIFKSLGVKYTTQKSPVGALKSKGG